MKLDKKFFIVFKLSFVFFILLIYNFKNEEVFNKISFYCIIAFIYQIIYIFTLRKKEDISFSKAISCFVVYIVSSIGINMIFYYVKIFFNGYTPIALDTHPQTYYGWEAIKKTPASILYIPYWLFNAIVVIKYELKYKE